MEIWTLCYFLYNEWHNGLVGGGGVPPLKKPCGDLLKNLCHFQYHTTISEIILNFFTTAWASSYYTYMYSPYVIKIYRNTNSVPHEQLLIVMYS